MRIDANKLLSARSERVKFVDFHSTEPWVLVALYSGSLAIWDYTSQTQVKQIEVSTVPLRSARFVPRCQWVVCGCDDNTIKAYNYHSLELVAVTPGHADYIRSLAVHPTLPVVLSSSDDSTIKIWSWATVSKDKGIPEWTCLGTLEVHAHYVMSVTWNPRDSNQFASGSLDKSIRVWSFAANQLSLLAGAGAGSIDSSSISNYQLVGHGRGVNCVEFSPFAERHLLVSGSDDRTVRVWDYQTKQCLRVLEGHTGNILSVAFHNRMPLIISSGEDGLVKMWHSTTFKVEGTLNYLMDRAWSVSCVPSIEDTQDGMSRFALSSSPVTTAVAIGYDEGTVVVALGDDEPVFSFQNGRLVLAKMNDLVSLNFSQQSDSGNSSSFGQSQPEPSDEWAATKHFEPVLEAPKALGTCEIYPRSVAHSPNGRYIAACGDGDYVVYTSQVLRSKAFGKADSFAWSDDSEYYATRLSSTGEVTVYRGFKKHFAFRLDGAADADGKQGVPSPLASLLADGYEAAIHSTAIYVEDLAGGPLLGLRCSDCAIFYSWDEQRLVQRIDVPAPPTRLIWSPSGKRVAIVTKGQSCFVLSYDQSAVRNAVDSNHPSDEAVDDAFNLVCEINDYVSSGIWIDDSCFVYTNKVGKLLCLFDAVTEPIGYCDVSGLVLAGHEAETGVIFGVSPTLAVYKYSLDVRSLIFKALIVSGRVQDALKQLKNASPDQRHELAIFLESKGHKAEALDIATDQMQRFRLAMALDNLKLAFEICNALEGTVGASTVDSERNDMWRTLGDRALKRGNIDMAEKCFTRCNDGDSLLFMALCLNDSRLMQAAAVLASKQSNSRMKFLVDYCSGNPSRCVETLVQSEKVSSAALFAKTYAPASLQSVYELWMNQLGGPNSIYADTLADPKQSPSLFV